MVLDYSERKPVGKNRPRKQPAGLFAFILTVAVAISFGAGVLTGMFMSRSTKKPVSVKNPLVQEAMKGAQSAPVPAAPLPNPEAAAAKGADPPLTFYETLPKGGKAVIGSGLNPKKVEYPVQKTEAPASPAPQPAAAPKVVPPPSVAKPAAAPKVVPPPPAAKPEERKEPSRPAAEQAKRPAPANTPPVPQQAASAGKFCIQVASYQDKKDAETVRSRLAEKGLAAYIVESVIKDKGTWYRVRIGRHLTQQAAGEMAGKAGKGALVIPE
jgi:cell division protein FtsN